MQLHLKCYVQLSRGGSFIILGGSMCHGVERVFYERWSSSSSSAAMGEEASGALIGWQHTERKGRRWEVKEGARPRTTKWD